MKNLLFIGYDYHKKTKSTDFLINLFEKYFHVDFIWSSPQKSSFDFKLIDIENKYEIIVVFQIMLSPSLLDQLDCKNIILIPMYDNDLRMNYYDWLEYKNFKFICFSESLYQKLNFLGFKDNNLYLQYAPSIDYKIDTSSNTKKFKIFFWPRSKEINIELIKKLIPKNLIESIHIHRVEKEKNKDFWFIEPSKEDITNYNISFSSWFENKDQLNKKIQESDIFIVPRLYEGIGQTFLEAMSYGKCVVSPNHPTMNEYIQNGYNGILFDYHNPEYIDLNNFEQLCLNAQNTIKSISDNWSNKEKDIIEFLNKKITAYSFQEIKRNLKKVEVSIDKKDHSFILDDIKIISPKKTKAYEFSQYLNLIHTFIDEIKNTNEKFILYGAGTGGKLLISLLPNSIECIVDKNPKLINTTLNNINIFPIEKLTEIEKHPIIITVFGREKEIKEQLSKKYSNKIISLDF